MCTEIQTILSGNKQEASGAVQAFLEKNAKVFTFSELSKNNHRRELWKALFNFICSNETSELHAGCLAAIRILSRDKTDLDQLITEERLDLLLQRAELKGSDGNVSNLNYPVAVEALKCLCNIIYNSPVAAAICSKNKCLEGIMDRSKKFRDSQLPLDIKMFDMKVLFLITALCDEVRPKMKEELHGLTYLIEILELVVGKGDQEKSEHNADVNNVLCCDSLSNAQVDLICEVLKVLFNLTVRGDINADVDEEEEAHYLQLVAVLRTLLLTKIESRPKELELHNHIVNLLTNMPNKCYKPLAIPLQDGEEMPKDLQYEEQNMKAVYQLFAFLESRFIDDVTIRNQQELLSPILTVLLKGVNSSRAIRKYLRLKILPPLRDVHNRPEQGSTLRNCLCRLLTTPMTNVRDLTADLLFILCKENVGRMIKYTGYGNAAGLFAQRGLLGGGPPGGVRPGEGRFSSDSEDSDTEEYREYKHGINPVIGCYEAPHPSATANMTEEQKEYEAMKLVNLMDDLTRKGVVQPCRIGEDGRPQPIEHVLQLQESLPSQQVRTNNGDDDDD